MKSKILSFNSRYGDQFRDLIVTYKLEGSLTYGMKYTDILVKYSFQGFITTVIYYKGLRIKKTQELCKAEKLAIDIW